MYYFFLYQLEPKDLINFGHFSWKFLHFPLFKLTIRSNIPCENLSAIVLRIKREKISILACSENNSENRPCFNGAENGSVWINGWMLNPGFLCRNECSREDSKVAVRGSRLIRQGHYGKPGSFWNPDLTLASFIDELPQLYKTLYSFTYLKPIVMNTW